MKPSRLVQVLERIYTAAIAAVEPEQVVSDFLKRRGSELQAGDTTYNLDEYRNVYLVGTGKAGAPMASAVETVLGDHLKAGYVVVRRGGKPAQLSKTVIRASNHPIPDENGHTAARGLIRFLKNNVSERDLLLVIISGGGSALLPAPVEQITLEEKQRTTEILLKSGATIQEINAIRKHLSRLKGGRLLEHAAGCRVVTMMLSDVAGDDPASIASGPTVPDRTTFGQCLDIIAAYNISEALPQQVVDYLTEGAEGQKPDIRETLTKGDARFDLVQNSIIGNNLIGLRAARQTAEKLGFPALVLTSSLEGNTADLASFYASMAREVLQSGNPLPAPCCILSGGEPTVRVTGSGKGGRNQELSLCFLNQFEDNDRPPILFASVGSDGIDGPTEAAGAWVTPGCALKAKALGLAPGEFLSRNDSFHFFEKLGNLIITGETQTNVMDFQILLIDTP
jgi:hydroxypyruvate reductase